VLGEKGCIHMRGAEGPAEALETGLVHPPGLVLGVLVASIVAVNRMDVDDRPARDEAPGAAEGGGRGQRVGPDGNPCLAAGGRRTSDRAGGEQENDEPRERAEAKPHPPKLAIRRGAVSHPNRNRRSAKPY
jgi:hypothetical protein